MKSWRPLRRRSGCVNCMLRPLYECRPCRRHGSCGPSPCRASLRRSCWCPCTTRRAARPTRPPRCNAGRQSSADVCQIAASTSLALAPQFHCSFVFTEPVTSIFSPHAALVLEFYAQPADRGCTVHCATGADVVAEWSPRPAELLAYVCIGMDAERYKALRCVSRQVLLDPVIAAGAHRRWCWRPSPHCA